MKIPIVMPMYNRPEFLSQVLESLQRCDDLEHFKVYTSEEPGQPDVQKLVEQINFIEVERHVNHKRLGCNDNVPQAIDIGFSNGDFVVILEDDIVCGKDFLSLCLWAKDNLKDNPNIFSITGFSQPPKNESELLAGRLLTKSFFWPYGWATWKDRWEHPDIKEIKARSSRSRLPSWDCNLADMHVKPRGLLSVYPSIARTKNIGTHGEYTPSANWHREQFANRGFVDDNPKYLRKEFYVEG